MSKQIKEIVVPVAALNPLFLRTDYHQVGTEKVEVMHQQEVGYPIEVVALRSGTGLDEKITLVLITAHEMYYQSVITEPELHVIAKVQEYDEFANNNSAFPVEELYIWDQILRIVDQTNKKKLVSMPLADYNKLLGDAE